MALKVPSGKGFWIWQILQVQKLYNEAHLQVKAVAAEAVRLGVDHVVVKIATDYGRYNMRRPDPNVAIVRWDDLIPTLAHELQKNNVEVYGYAGAVGGTVNYPERNARFHVERALQFGLDGLIVNAEGQDWQSSQKRYSAATIYARTAQQVSAGRISIGLSTYRFIRSSQPYFPAREFMEYLDYAKPQIYWVGRHDPVEQLQKAVSEWRTITPKPIIPDGAAYTERRASYRMPDGSLWLPTEDDLLKFNQAVRAGGHPGYTLWEWRSAHQYELLDIIASLHWPHSVEDPPPPLHKYTDAERLALLWDDYKARTGLTDFRP